MVCLSAPAAIAFFRCDMLAYLGHVVLPGPCGDAPWVAVNDAGELFTSRTDIGLSGSYPTPLFITRRVRLTAEGGVTRIGG
jgi:hypothetical protein